MRTPSARGEEGEKLGALEYRLLQKTKRRRVPGQQNRDPQCAPTIE